MAKRYYNYSNLAEAFGRATERNMTSTSAAVEIAATALMGVDEPLTRFEPVRQNIQSIFTPPPSSTTKRRMLLLDKKMEETVLAYMPDRDMTGNMAHFFAQLSDPTRLRIISALSISGMCVGDLSAVLEMNQTTLSHQLHNLKRGGIVESSRQGKVVFYKIKNKVLQDILLLCLEFV